MKPARFVPRGDEPGRSLNATTLFSTSIRRIGLAILLAAFTAAHAGAQRPPAAPTAPAPTAPAIEAPDGEGLVILIGNTILALNHANLTGNYSVLRDLGAPDFQKINSPQRLATIFSSLRTRRLNFAPIILFQPKFVRQPAIDDKGFLRTTGFYETHPLQVHFNLVFQSHAGAWRLFEISVWTAILP